MNIEIFIIPVIVFLLFIYGCTVIRKQIEIIEPDYNDNVKSEDFYLIIFFTYLCGGFLGCASAFSLAEKINNFVPMVVFIIYFCTGITILLYRKKK